VVGAKTKEERDEWLLLLQSKIFYVEYLTVIDQQNARPDTRIVALLTKRNISHVVLDGEPLTVRVIKILGEVFAEHKEIERLSLADASIDDEALAALAGIIGELPHLVSLNLSKNNFTAKGINELVQAMSKHNALRELRFSHSHVDDDGLERLCHLFASNIDLEVLDLSHNKIVGSAKVISGFVASLSSLKLLSGVTLHHNQLGDEAMHELAALVTTHPSIQTIELQNNYIGNNGCCALLKALQTNKSVRRVNLSANGIGTQGLEALKALFSKNTVLEVVNLSENKNLIGGPELLSLGEIEGVTVNEFAVVKT